MMTRRRISNRTPRELTAKERSALSDVVLELDSDFRVKTGSVANISLETPESGVIVLNELDGRMYYADDYGWHRFGDPYSPITLFFEYDGATAVQFKFKAPSTSTLKIHDGDGTVTEVDGNDDTIVVYAPGYSIAGTYYFSVVGDVLDVTMINEAIPANGPIGDVNSWSLIPGLTKVYGYNSDLYGDISYFNGNTLLEEIIFHHSFISGDVSKLYTLPSLVYIDVHESNCEFNGLDLWSLAAASTIDLTDCKLTSTMVDNALQSFVNLTGCTIKLGGNNAKRTARSDAAKSTLETAGCTITVNE